jgi:hypothetical protein
VRSTARSGEGSLILEGPRCLSLGPVSCLGGVDLFEVFIIHRHGVGDSMTVICVFKAVYTVTFTKLCGFWTRIFPTLVPGVPARKKFVRAAKLIFYLSTLQYTSGNPGSQDARTEHARPLLPRKAVRYQSLYRTATRLQARHPHRPGRHAHGQGPPPRTPLRRTSQPSLLSWLCLRSCPHHRSQREQE